MTDQDEMSVANLFYSIDLCERDEDGIAELRNALTAAQERGRREGLEGAAKVVERSGVCSADPVWNRSQIAAAIRALNPKER